MHSHQQKELSPTLLSLFFNSLGVLLKAGIPIQNCLSLMLEDSKDDSLKEILSKLNTEIKTTFQLHLAMQQTGLFSEYAIQMVKIGETSGRLEAVCKSLADYYEQKDTITAQMKRSILNPVILICVVSAVITFLVLKVLPIFSNVYAQLGIYMEQNSMILAALTIGKTAMILSLILLLFLGICGLMMLSSSGKKQVLHMISKIPKVKKIISGILVSQFSSALSMLLQSGMDPEHAMELSSGIIQNEILDDKLINCKKDFKNGVSIAEALAKNQIFSPFHTSILLACAKAGATDQALKKLSEEIMEDSMESLENAMGLIEPILVAVLSVIIGIILLCIMLPLIGILSSMG
jgi:type IV pilus assembly protein PilC